MMMVKTFVAPSEIQGLGVFAAEFIPAGTELWLLNPKFDVFIHAHELAHIPSHMREYIERYSYPHLDLPGTRVLDCDDGKFMNHTDRPNTDFREFERGFALVDISVGEEITCSYYEFDPEFVGFGAPTALESAIAALQATGLPASA